MAGYPPAMAHVEVYLSPGRAIEVSYDPRLVEAALESVRAHDKQYRTWERSRRGRAPVPSGDGMRADPDRVKWQGRAYTLSATNAHGARLVLLDDGEAWSLVAVDDSGDDDSLEADVLNSAEYGVGASMLNDFARKAAADAR